MSDITQQADAGTLVKTVHVSVEVDRAFELFTTHMARWWPLPTHSVGQQEAAEVTVDGQVGGLIVETISDGRTAIWGTVTCWDPPTTIRFTWHPGTPVDEATLVSVRFRSVDGGTDVELTHTGWDARPDAARARHGYDSGWDYVFGKYVALVS